MFFAHGETSITWEFIPPCRRTVPCKVLPNSFTAVGGFYRRGYATFDFPGLGFGVVRRHVTKRRKRDRIVGVSLCSWVDPPLTGESRVREVGLICYGEEGKRAIRSGAMTPAQAYFNTGFDTTDPTLELVRSPNCSILRVNAWRLADVEEGDMGLSF